MRGEISNLRAQANGNVYFDLKDRDALLNCVAFSEAAASFPELANGDEVVAYGSVQTYAKASRYQLRVLDVEPVGSSGALHRRYEQLKARLGEEGLFAQERKRALPRFPFRVALITSQQADGARDFLTQARARAPHVEIRLDPDAGAGRERRARDRARDRLRLGAAVRPDRAGARRRLVRGPLRVQRRAGRARAGERRAPDRLGDRPRGRRAADRLRRRPPRRDALGRGADRAAAARRPAGAGGRRRRALGRDVERLVSARRQHVDVAARHLRAAARERVRRRGDVLVRPGAPARRRRARRAPGPAARPLREPARPARARRAGCCCAAAPSAWRGLAARLERADPALLAARAGRAARRPPSGWRRRWARFFGRRVALLDRLNATIEGNNPEAILQRGYAIVYDDVGRLLRDPAWTRRRARASPRSFLAEACGPASNATDRMADDRSASFEESLRRLEAIVKTLETEDPDLERAVTLYQEGKGLVSRCGELLAGAQQAIDAVNAPAARPVEDALDDDEIPSLTWHEARRLDALVAATMGLTRSQARGADPGRQGARRRRAGDQARRARPRGRARRGRSEPPRYVSRGGDKLDGALRRRSALDVTGLEALDVGASTGGFTDALLQRGAAHVTALDVGYGQLAWKLRGDPRVTVIERTNFRTLRGRCVSRTAST